jgi:hypothetical protein
MPPLLNTTSFNLVFLTILTGTTEYTVGTITEVKENAISFHVEYLSEDHTFEITKDSQLYDSKGNKITIADLKPGDRAKLTLLPKTPEEKEWTCTTLKLQPKKGPTLPPPVVIWGPPILLLTGYIFMLTTGYVSVGLVIVSLGFLIRIYPILF